MKNPKLIKILLSVRSPFYSPVFLTKDFLEKEGQAVQYSERLNGEDRLDLIYKNKVNIVAAAVSLHWEPENIDKREGIYHFAQINCRDGFFLVGRETGKKFSWNNLASKRLLVHPGRQPEMALKYTLNKNMRKGAWKNIYILKINNFKLMLRAFRQGIGDFIHLQGYWAQKLVAEDENLRIVTEVGGKKAKVPEYSFSSLMASGQFIEGSQFKPFIEAYKKALNYAVTRKPQKIAEKLKCFFPDAEVSGPVLESCIKQYQMLGCWRKKYQITEEDYWKAMEIILETKDDLSPLPYENVVRTA